MIGVTAFGLIFTPAFYIVTRWLGDTATRLMRRGAPAPHPEPGPAE